MKKDHLGEVLFSIKRRQKTLCTVKVYNDGRVYRTGNGIRPCGEFTVYTEPTKSKIFSETLKHIPEHLPSTHLFGLENDINDTTTEYLLAFYGGELSVINGNQEHWEYNSGIRIIYNPGTHYKHPLLPLVLQIGEKMLELTDYLYFDYVLNTVFQVKPAHFPKIYPTKIPTGYSERLAALEKYIDEISEIHKWDKLMEYAKGQIYFNHEGQNFHLKTEPHVKVLSMKPVNREVQFAGILSYSNMEQNIARPKYERGVQIYDGDDLPMNLALNALKFVLIIAFSFWLILL